MATYMRGNSRPRPLEGHMKYSKHNTRQGDCSAKQAGCVLIIVFSMQMRMVER
jgi:hypothetical protein